MLPSLSVFDGIWGALEGLTGVFEVKGYENPTASTTLEGIPPYSMAFVLIGGIDQEIGDTIRLKKTAGTPTFGTQSVISTDTHGQTTQIFFSKAVTNTIGVNIALTALAGYVSTTGEAIKLAVSQYIDSLSIGSTIYVSKLCPPAELYNAPESNTYRITSITANKNAGPFVSTQITQAFNESAQCLPANVTIIVS
jgi:uncharacterized phage protein gp47/JayE